MSIIDSFRTAESRVEKFIARIAPAPVADPNTATIARDSLSLSSTGPALPALPGFKTGDSLDIDGPLWANGTGRITKLDSKTLEMQFTVRDPSDLPGVRSLIHNPYTRKDGKVSLSLKIEQLANGQVQTTIRDLNSGKPVPGAKGTLVEGRKGSHKQLAIATPNVTITMTFKGPGQMNVALSTVPVGSFDVTRQ